MAAPSVDDLARSFERYLRAGNKSPRTVETYLEDVETWIALLLGRWKPSTAHNRYRSLHAFYRWLEEEEASRVRWRR